MPDTYEDDWIMDDNPRYPDEYDECISPKNNFNYTEVMPNFNYSRVNYIPKDEEDPWWLLPLGLTVAFIILGSLYLSLFWIIPFLNTRLG